MPQKPATPTDGIGTAGMTALLFPDGLPDLVDAMAVNGERADLRWAVGVLMGNRDLLRRLAAESGERPMAAA
jgi:hypothetical protein